MVHRILYAGRYCREDDNGAQGRSGVSTMLELLVAMKLKTIAGVPAVQLMIQKPSGETATCWENILEYDRRGP